MAEKFIEEEQGSLFQTMLVILLALVFGVGISILILPGWLPGLLQSLVGNEVKSFWYLSRSSAVLGFVFLWLSMVFGLLLSNRLAGKWLGGKTTNEFHNFFSILGLLFSAFHALILIGDAYLKPSLLNILAPFGLAEYRPFWVGLGQIGFYLWFALVISFYLRKNLGYSAWRKIHYGSFLLFILVLVHGIMSGTDSTSTEMVGLYLMSASSTIFLVFFRILSKLFSEKKTTSTNKAL